MGARGWPLLLALLLWCPLWAGEDAEEEAAAKNAALLQQLKKNAAARRNVAPRTTSRRSVVRVSAKQAGALDVDKLNAMLANEALRNRRPGGVGGSAGAGSSRKTLVPARGAGTMPVASATPGAATVAPATPATPNANGKVDRRAPVRRNARRGYDSAVPASSRGGRADLSRMDKAAIQKAVEDALDKHEAASFTGRLRQWLSKLLPVAGKTAAGATALR